MLKIMLDVTKPITPPILWSNEKIETLTNDSISYNTYLSAVKDDVTLSSINGNILLLLIVMIMQTIAVTIATNVFAMNSALPMRLSDMIVLHPRLSNKFEIALPASK